MALRAVMAAAVSILALDSGAANAQATGTGLGASHVVFAPTDPSRIFVASTLYGVYKSVDGGETWQRRIDGFGASDFYALAVHPKDARVLLAGAAGGGIYRSIDGGDTWVASSNGLSDTSVYDLAFDANDPETVYALTLREVFRSKNGGRSWAPLFHRDATIVDSSFHRRLWVIAGPRPVFLVATSNAAYRREEGAERWTKMENGLAGAALTAFGVDAQGALYAGGTFAKGLFRSLDAGRTWEAVGGGLSGVWVNRVAFDASTVGVGYLATKNRGVLKTTDGGVNWKAINQGLTEPDIKALAIHPRDPTTLFAATYGRGIFVSRDGGRSWTHRPVPKFPTWEALYASLTRKSEARVAHDPPAVFSKCQGCHGWTDPALNGPTRETFWRVFPSHREWSATMARMRDAARITPAEEATILAYLNRYYGVEARSLFSEERAVRLSVFPGGGCFPTNVVAADLNVDGRLDLVVSGFCNRFAVLFADPERAGAFLPPREITVPTSAIGIAVVPLEPGRPPLVVVSNCANPDAIDREPLLHVVSMETFEVIETLPSGGIAPDDIAVEDFDGDGRADLAVGHWKGGVLSVLLGEGADGRFRVPTPESPQRVVVGDEHWQVLARDFDRDGIPDLAVPIWTVGARPDDARTAQVAVFRGDGAGAVAPTPVFSTPVDREARSLAAADFDGDGALDLAVANPGSGRQADGRVMMLYGKGGSQFTAGEIAGDPLVGPQGIAAADFDGDGRPDVAVANRPVSGDGRITILLNDGSGRFAQARRESVSFGARARVSALSFQPLIAADLDADGAPDLVVADNHSDAVSIFFNGRGAP